VLPNTQLPDDFALPECPRWKIIDRTELPKLVHKLHHILIRQEIDRPLLTQEGICQLTTALSGRGLPQRDVVAGALANEDAADALTEHHGVILDAIRLIHRVEVRGGAGSGKTFLAMEQARRLAQKGHRVALICYSHGLASYLERISAAWPRRQRPAYVGEFYALGVLWGAPEGPDEALRSEETVRFWEHDLPLQMTELAAQLRSGHRFAALKDDETGGLYVFTDEGQRVFNRYGSPPVPLVPLVLDHNLRNTRQIANAFQALVDHPMRFLGGEGPAVKFVACAREGRWTLATTKSSCSTKTAGGPKTSRCSPPAPATRTEGTPSCKQRRLLRQLLGRRAGVLWPRPRLQGSRASRCCLGEPSPV
jgi:hypothetical protein